MISNLCLFEGGDKEIHRLSEGYPGYSQEETDAKIKQAIGFGKPLTCKYIRAQGFACSYDCGVKSPAGLKSSRAHKIEVIQPLSAQRDETIAFMKLIASKGMLGLPTGYPHLDEVSRGKGYGRALVWSSCYLTNICCKVEIFKASMKKSNMPS